MLEKKLPQCTGLNSPAQKGWCETCNKIGWYTYNGVKLICDYYEDIFLIEYRKIRDTSITAKFEKYKED